MRALLYEMMVEVVLRWRGATVGVRPRARGGIIGEEKGDGVDDIMRLGG